MPEATVKRTLVKSPPELWAEISDAEALARHLGEFGEIRITRTDPETTVAWEGDRARGTVEIEASGWGTKVILTAQTLDAAVAQKQEQPEPQAVVAEPEPVVVVPEPVAPEPAPVAIEAEPEATPTVPPEPVVKDVVEPEPVVPDPVACADVPAPAATDPVPEPRKPGFLARLFGRKPKPEPVPVAQTTPVVTPEPVVVAEPVVPAPVAAPAPVVEAAPPADPAPALRPVPEPEGDPAPVIPLTRPTEPDPGPPAAAEAAPVIDAERATEILTVVLDDLGAAHHRPFSRS